MTVLFRLLCLGVFLSAVPLVKGEETRDPWHPEFVRAYFEKSGTEPRSPSKHRIGSNADFDSRRACVEALNSKDNDKIRQHCDSLSRIAPIDAGQGHSVSEVTEANSTRDGSGGGATTSNTNTTTSEGTTSGSGSGSDSGSASTNDCVITTWNTCSDSTSGTPSDGGSTSGGTTSGSGSGPGSTNDCVVTTWNTCSDSTSGTPSDGGSTSGGTTSGGSSCSSPDLQTQSDVNAFPPHCEHITGNLRISGNYSYTDPVTDLTPLSGIRSIAGNLNIWSNPELRAIDPLGSLNTVNGLIEIYDNPKLIDLQGLQGLSFAGGGLDVWQNDLLESLVGLQNVAALGDDAVLLLSGNPNLRDIDHFDGLKTSGGHEPRVVSISYNASLASLDGLEWIGSIDQALVIQYNPKLSDVGALARTTSVGRSQYTDGGTYYLVTDNSSLTNCAGLANALGWPEVYWGLSTDNSTVRVESNGPSSSCSSATGILNSVSGPSTPVLKNYTAENGRLSVDFTDSTSDPLYPVSGYLPMCSTTSSASDTRQITLPDYQLVNRYLSLSPRGLPPASFTNLSWRVNEVAVELDVSHDFPEQLIIDLTFPSGESVNLRNQEGSGSADIVDQFPPALSSEENEQAWNSAQVATLEGAFKLSLMDNVGPINGIIREGMLNRWDINAYQGIYTPYLFPTTSSFVKFDQLVNGNRYECVVYPNTYLGLFESTGLKFSFTQQLVPPAAPAVTGARPDIDSARVAVSPAYPEGEEVSKYQVTCRGDDLGDTVIADSSDNSVDIDGLEGGSTYTCTARTYNASGYGAPSTPFVLEPEALQAGLPIWLLYEAIKNK